LKVRPGKREKLEIPPRVNLEKLSGEKAEKYAVKVSNGFEALGALEEERSPDELWKETREILLDVAASRSNGGTQITKSTPGAKLAIVMTHLSSSNESGKQNRKMQLGIRN